MDVPFPLTEEAAEALRAAEMDGDLSKLDELRQKLTIPLDAWLAPGERELRRDRDFAATPSAFLKFLRWKAADRGLRLNGRRVPGAVWVRPQMTQSNVEARTLYPDLFPKYADPAPYAEHHDPDDAPLRPYVGARSQKPDHDVTPVVFVDAPVLSDRSSRCPCGSSGDDSRHT